MDVKFQQPQNASSSILTSPEGNVTEIKFLFKENTSFPIFTVLEGNTIANKLGNKANVGPSIESGIILTFSNQKFSPAPPPPSYTVKLPPLTNVTSERSKCCNFPSGSNRVP